MTRAHPDSNTCVYVHIHTRSHIRMDTHVWVDTRVTGHTRTHLSTHVFGVDTRTRGVQLVYPHEYTRV